MPAKTSTRRLTTIQPIIPPNPKGSVFCLFGGPIGKGYIYLGYCDCITEQTLTEFVGKLNIPITKSTRINYLFVTNPKAIMENMCQDMSYYRISQDELILPTGENWFKCSENEMTSSMKKINKQPNVFKFNKADKKKKTTDDNTTSTIVNDSINSTSIKTKKTKSSTGEKKSRKTKTSPNIDDEPPTIPESMSQRNSQSQPVSKPKPKPKTSRKPDPEPELDNVDQMMQSIRNSDSYNIANGDTQLVSDDETEEESGEESGEESEESDS